MSTTTGTGPPAPAAAPPEASIRGRAYRRADRLFAGLTRGAGIAVLLIMASIGVFLVWKAVPALRVNSVSFFTYQQWFPDPAESGAKPAFGIAALAFGTLMTA